MESNNLPVYKLVINDDEQSGVKAISFVEYPATMMDWQAFSATPKYTFQIVSEEKRLVSGPAMVADMPIYRRDDETGQEYYVVFDAATIEKIRDKFSKKSLFHATNQMHNSDKQMEGVHMVESYLVDYNRGVMAPAMYPNITNGSWMVAYKVDNNQVWSDVKDGKFKGFSVEGYFKQVLVDTKSADELEALANEIAAFTDKIAQSEKNILHSMKGNKTTVENLKSAFAGLKKIFDEVTKPENTQKFFSVQTSDDKTLEVNDPDGDGIPVIGDTVKDGDKPAADGEYQLKDGSAFTIVGGAITAVSQPAPLDMSAELAKVIEMATQTFTAFKKETEDKIEKFAGELKTASEKNAELSKTIEANKTEMESQRKLIDETFKVVEILASAPADTDNPDESQKTKLAKENTRLKNDAIDRISKFRKSQTQNK